jgi:BTB/POZ domain
LCYYSPVFNKAFNGVFLEGETQTMTLEDVDASVFGLLVSWLYTGDIATRESRQHDNSFKLYQKPIQLAKLWILGERFLMPRLQNRVVDEIFIAIDVMFDVKIYKSIENETPAELVKSFVQFAYSAGSPTLQRLAVSILGHRCPEKIFMQLIDGLPKEAWLDVAKVLKWGEEMMCVEDFYFAEG